MLKLFNTFTRRKEVFKASRRAKRVGFYFCGPTVYDYAHIGNLRAYVFADLLRRYLEFLGCNVKMVMNITDVDDKTINNSRKEGISLQEFTQRYEKAFFEDLAKLRIKPADVYPRATEHINEMITLINDLLKRGFAYISNDGVYFDISKFKDYGKLSKLEIKELSSRARQDEYSKEQVQDFALWKAWSTDDGDVFWSANFNGKGMKGRPGWHIECSAMSTKYLKTVDIHGGGVDLIFPHHENEIAQCAGNFVRYWVHCEHLLVNGQKMSKSLGNFYTLRDLLEKGHEPLAVRFLLINAHYRQQLNFTFDSLEKAKETVDAISDFVGKLKFLINKVTAKVNKKLAKDIVDAKKKFVKYMDDDLNVPQALAAVFEMMNKANKAIDSNKADRKSLKMALKLLTEINIILDIIVEQPLSLTKEEKALIEKREQLRKEKKFAEADKIRTLLKERGILLEDTPYGPRAKKAKS